MEKLERTRLVKRKGLVQYSRDAFSKVLSTVRLTLAAKIFTIIILELKYCSQLFPLRSIT